jgi:hypothetical protein
VNIVSLHCIFVHLIITKLNLIVVYLNISLTVSYLRKDTCYSFQRGSSYGSLITAHGKYQLFAKTGYFKVRLSEFWYLQLLLTPSHPHMCMLTEGMDRRVGELRRAQLRWLVRHRVWFTSHLAVWTPLATCCCCFCLTSLLRGWRNIIAMSGLECWYVAVGYM